MQDYFAKDRFGNNVNFTISGATPTPTEQARIDAVLSGGVPTPRTPPTPEDKPGILSLLGSGLASGWDTVQAGTYTELERQARGSEGGTFLGGTPDEYRAKADAERQQIAERQQEIALGEWDEQEGFYDKARFLAHTLGQSAPPMAAGLVAGAATTALTKNPFAGYAAMTAFSAGASYPMLLNENIERQIEQHGTVKNWDAAAGTAGVQAVLEGGMDAVTGKVAGIFGRPLSGAMDKAVKAGVNEGLVEVAKRAGGAIAVGSIGEGLTEALQEYLTRHQAEMPTDSPEAMKAYMENATIGAILGGVLGGTLGTVGGVQDVRQQSRLKAAQKDAKEEREQLAAAGATADERMWQHNLDQFPEPDPDIIPDAQGTAGLLPDLTEQVTAEQAYIKGQEPTKGQEEIEPETKVEVTGEDKTQDFSRQDYFDTINSFRGKRISIDGIKVAMKVGHTKAKAIYDALLTRGDAKVVNGSFPHVVTPPNMTTVQQKGKSGRIERGVESEYQVRKVDDQSRTPYAVTMNGEPVGKNNRFKTEEEAREWAVAQGVPNYGIAYDPDGQQFGLYKDQYVYNEQGDRIRSGTEVVNTFSSIKEANQALKSLDPDYDPQTEYDLQKAAQRDLARQQYKDDTDWIQNELTKTVGEMTGGRARAVLVPKITPEIIKSFGLNPGDVKPGTIIEALIGNDQAMGGFNKIVLASRDYFDADPETAFRQLKSLVAGHEVGGHFAWEVMTPQEKRLISKKLNERVPDKPYSWLERSVAREGKAQPSQEEAFAEMVRYHMDNPSALDAPTRGVINRILNLIKRLLRIADGRTANDVIRDILSGDLTKREPPNGGRKSRDVFYSQIASNPFYTKTERFLAGLKQEKATGKQWSGMLKNAGIKKEEADWLGLDDWLIENGNSVLPKSELENFIKANAVEIVVELKSQTPDDAEKARLQAAFEKAEAALIDRWEQESETFRNDFFDRHAGGDLLERYAEHLEIADGYTSDDANIGTNYIIAFTNRNEKKGGPDAPRHSSFVQPGGTNYQEFLIRIPQMQGNFVRDSHFSEPNIIAHARTTDIWDGSRRGLRIEEVQSDLHQAGRRQGYDTSEAREERNRIHREIKSLAEEGAKIVAEADRLVHDDALPAMWERYRELGRRIRELQDENANLPPKSDIPDAPFKTTWEEFALKNLLQYASKNNYDFVEWHGSHQSIGATEGYQIDHATDGFDNEGNPVTPDDPKYFQVPSGNNVTSIVNRYLEKLPRIAKKLANKFQSVVEHVGPDQSSLIPTIPEPEQVLKDYIQNIDDFSKAVRKLRRMMDDELSDPDTTRTDAELMDADYMVQFWEEALQAAINQRQFDPVRPFMGNGPVMEGGLLWLRDGIPPFGPKIKTEEQAAIQQKFRLQISEPMREAFVKDDIPRFSILPAYKQEIMQNPNFQSWFAGSTVTDEDGSPKIVYHSSMANKDFGAFKPLSHFGSLNAAQERLSTSIAGLSPHGITKIASDNGIDPNNYKKVNEWWDGLGSVKQLDMVAKFYPDLIDNARVFPVMLAIRNPVRIVDEGDQHDYRVLSVDLENEGILNSRESWVARNWVGPNKLIELLERKGYDGFVYENSIEDPGSQSYIALRQSQIKSVWNRGEYMGNDVHFSGIPTVEEMDLADVGRKLNGGANATTDDYNAGPLDLGADEHLTPAKFSMLPARTQEVMQNPKFQKWFRGSVVRNPDGSPMVVYHGTFAEQDFDSFRYMSHFGSLGAAHDRLQSTITAKWSVYNAKHPGTPYPSKGTAAYLGFPDYGIGGQYDEAYHNLWNSLPSEKKIEAVMMGNPHLVNDVRVYPMMLSLQNPIEVYDNGLRDFRDFARDLRERQKDARGEPVLDYKEHADAIAATTPRKLITILERKGYDGFKYMNRVEDRGSISWVPFRKGQIKSIFNKGEFNYRDNRVNYSALPSADVGNRVSNEPPVSTLERVERQLEHNTLSPLAKKIVGFALDKGVIGDKTATSIRKKIDGSIINFQDRMMSLGDLVDRIRKNGGLISNETDPYLQQQLFSGKVEQMLHDNDRTIYRPMLETINNLDVTMEDTRRAKRVNAASEEILTEYLDRKMSHKAAMAELYLYAQHAQERNALMRERNENLQEKRPFQHDHGSGMTDSEAIQILNWFRGQRFGAKFNSTVDPTSVRSRFRALIKNTNDLRVSSRLQIDFRTARDQNGDPYYTYADYAPIRGMIERDAISSDIDFDKEYARIGKGFRIAGKEDPSALGRRSLGADILAHAILQNQEAIVRGEKNKVGLALRDMLDANVNDLEVGDRETGGQAALSDVAEVIEQFGHKFAYDGRTGQVRSVPDSKYLNDPNVLLVKDAGKMFAIRLKDNALAKAMNRTSTLGSGLSESVLGGLLSVNRILASVRTSWNPEFVVSNFLRDLVQALGNLGEFSEQDIKGIYTQVLKDVFPAIKDIARTELRRDVKGDMFDETQGSKWQQAYYDFKKYGGKTAFYGIREFADVLAKVNENIGTELDATPVGMGKAAAKYAGNKIKVLGSLVEASNTAVENGIRVATFELLRNRFLEDHPNPGSPDAIKAANEQAAKIAKNLTVNFNMGGDAKPFMNALYLFYNASMQGSIALINPLIRSKRVRKIWGGVFAAGVMQDVLMSMLSPEDDDGEKIYDKIPDHIFERNLVILDPFGISERGYFKWPLPYVFNGLYNMGRISSATARGKYTPGEGASKGFVGFIDGINPMGAANSFANFVAPTIADPVIDIALNQNFAGAPIAPPENPFGTSPKDSQRFWNNTSPIYVKIADVLSRATGGYGEYHEGSIELSPNTIQYWAEFMGGGALTFANRAMDLALPAPFGKEFTSGDWAANDIPIMRQFYGNVTSREDLQYYIENRDRVMKVRAELRDAAKSGDAARYQETVARFPHEYRIANQINRIESARKMLSREINKVRDNKNLSEERKKELIDAIKNRQQQLVGRGNAVLRGSP